MALTISLSLSLSPVHRARNLLIKGKNGKNNCYVTICVGKDKYMTTQQKDVGPDLEWHEQCELPIPEKGNRAELVLTCLHQNSFGLDDFLGQVTLPLNEMDVYETPRSRWYKLRSKPGKEKQKDRGELEVRIGFTVKSGSLTDLSGKKEKHKSSMGQLASNMGGSLLSINTLEKRKKMKNFAKSLGSKMHITGKKKKDKDGDGDSMAGSTSNVWPTPDQQRRNRGNLSGFASSGQLAGEADPGVISEDEDEFAFENLSHKSSGSSLNVSRHRPPIDTTSSGDLQRSSTGTALSSQAPQPDYRSMTLPTPPKPARTPQVEPKQDEWAEKLYGKAGAGGSGSLGSSDSLKRRSWEPSVLAYGERVPYQGSSSEKVAVVEEEEMEAPVTAPSSPAVSSTVRSSLPADKAQEPPQPLPRRSMESIVKEEKKENKFTKKFKYLRDFGRSEAVSSSTAMAAEKARPVIKPTLSGQFYNNQSERIIIGHENDVQRNGGELPKEVVQRYEGKSREEIMSISYQMENEVKYQKQRVKELEDYLDNLLLRVMETHPKILQSPITKLNTKSG